MNHCALNIDLHCHSTVSDGMFAPRELVQRAHANGVNVLALTDHDEVGGLAQAQQTAQELGMRFINGVEISVTWAGKTVHIVGLNFDPKSSGLHDGLHATRAGRAGRAKRIGERLASLGFPGAYEGALPFAGNPELISRTHFARFLVEAGHCPDMQTVFTKFLGDDSPGYEPMQWASLSEAVSWIRQAGGRAVIAHPGRYRYTPLQFGAFFDEFLQLGGEGIEVVTSNHSSEDAKHYARVAHQYGFLASRGSDFHSPTESRIDIGYLPRLYEDLKPVWHGWF